MNFQYLRCIGLLGEPSSAEPALPASETLDCQRASADVELPNLLSAEGASNKVHIKADSIESCGEEPTDLNVDLVDATTFSGLPADEQEGQRRLVMAALAKHAEWHEVISTLIPKHHIRLTCTSNPLHGLIAAHLSLHNDFKLIKLGRDYSFPRGFCVIVDTKEQRLVGQGTFYPKFQNDDRNSGFSMNDFGGISKLSCFIKYSGSTGIISIIRDSLGNVVGWTGSSKNSCNHDARPDAPCYAAETVSSFKKFVTQDFLKWCERRQVCSIGLEVFIASDQSHGYGYGASGCIVTSICAGGSRDGRPVYLSPEDMYAACREAGLPTDKPICVEGKSNIQSFIEALSLFRDLLTLGKLRQVLQEHCGIDLVTMHDSLVDSQIIEGFVIRRWKGDAEVEAVKFKIWLYQMVTQVLRPSFSAQRFPDYRKELTSLKAGCVNLRPDITERIQSEMQKWCLLPTLATKKLCKWVVLAAAQACLPSGHPQMLWSESTGDVFPADAEVPTGCLARDPSRAYWITLSDFAVRQFISHMDLVDWIPEKAVVALGL